MQKSDTTADGHVVNWSERGMPIQCARLNLPRGFVPPIENLPWAIIEPHRARAFKTHGQTLERLAERGGLSVCEALAIIEDREWKMMELIPAFEQLAAIVAAATARLPPDDYDPVHAQLKQALELIESARLGSPPEFHSALDAVLNGLRICVNAAAAIDPNQQQLL